MANTLTNLISQNVAPYFADHIGVYDSAGSKVGIIEFGEFKPTYGERLYRFGLLSDVHNQTDQTTENTADMERAFAWLNDKESVEFTVVCGDLCEYVHSTSDYTEWNLYKTNSETYSPNTPIYVTTGNHDCPHSGSFDNDSWKQYTGSNYNKTYELTIHGDHFLFLGEELYSLGSSGNPYLDDDITWLGQKLEEYKNERCFIITHLFFPGYAGNFKEIYPSGNWLQGTQLTNLKALVDAYPNTYWFSGHSHWKWYLQQYQENANVDRANNGNGGWTVHVPSCASPIDSDGTSTRVVKATESEGAIVDVYSDHIDIRGIDLKNGKYLPVAQYRLPMAIDEISAEDSGVYEADFFKTGTDIGKTSGSTYTADVDTDTLVFNLTAVSQGFWCMSADSATNYLVTYDSLSIVDGSGNTLSTDGTDSTLKIGCYQASDGAGTSYTLINGGTYTSASGSAGVYYLQLVQASSSASVTFPVTVTIKGLRITEA